MTIQEKYPKILFKKIWEFDKEIIYLLGKSEA